MLGQKFTLEVPYEKFGCKKDDFVATLTEVLCTGNSNRNTNDASDIQKQNESQSPNHIQNENQSQNQNHIQSENHKRPAVVVCPGGAYFFKCEREGEPVAQAFADAGMVTFLLDYSVTPNRFPAALMEVARSVQFVREHAEEYDIDTDRVVVCGFSAGGHLTSSLGTMWHEKFLWEALGTTAEMIQPNGIIPCYPVITSGEFTHIDSCINLITYEKCGRIAKDYPLNEDMIKTEQAMTEEEKQALWNNYDKLLAETRESGKEHIEDMLDFVSLEKRVTEKNAPTFIWTTYDDGLVPMENSLLFVQALRRANVPVTFHLYSTGIHGLSLATPEISMDPDGIDISDEVATWHGMAMEWIKKL